MRVSAEVQHRECVKVTDVVLYCDDKRIGEDKDSALEEFEAQYGSGLGYYLQRLLLSEGREFGSENLIFFPAMKEDWLRCNIKL